MSPDPPRVESRGLNRRSFLVALGSFVLGSFVMPDPLKVLGALATGNDESAAPPIVPAEDRLEQRVRRIINRPVKSKDGCVLAWVEKFDDGLPHVMVWSMETDEEFAEGNRFFEMTTWRSWNTRGELETLLAADPGPWLIRHNFGEVYNFFISKDLDWLTSAGDGDQVIFSLKPEEGVRCTSAEALRMVTGLMPVYGGGVIYIEPVKVADAKRNFRAEKFGLKAQEHA